MLLYIFCNVSGIKPIPAKQQKINNRALNIKAEMAASGHLRMYLCQAVVAHTYNLRTWKIEAGGALGLRPA